AAAMKNPVVQPVDGSQEEITAHLDEAIARLNPRESTAVVMRYLQNKTSAEVAEAIGVSEDAAQKISLRALPKLRRMLLGRGVVLSSAAGLIEAMVAASQHVAPPALHISTGIGSATASLSIAKGAMKIMFWAKAKTLALIAAAVVVVGGGTGIAVERQTVFAESANILVDQNGNIAAIYPNAVNIQPFESPFLQLDGCRIRQKLHLYLGLKPGEVAKPAAVIEQQSLEIDWSAEPDVIARADHYSGEISPSDGNTTGKITLAIPVRGTQLAKWRQPNIITSVPEPGDYLIQIEALDASNKPVARATLPMHVNPLPMTQLEINDVLPDGLIRSVSVMQNLNTSNSPIDSRGFINSDFVHLTKMWDENGKPVKFMARHEGSIYQYHYQLNNPVEPGQAEMSGTSGTVTGLITKIPGGMFQYSMRHHPGAGQPVRRIELYRLPAGADLIATVPANLPHRMVDGREQIFMETTIPANESNLVSFRYRLAANGN
ncbi:MAG TPA: sigma-70 family RNA polymerase sigma factor, partial [Tepidisphaeraceae bacterium]|nr:sigma-70 family RNA polymerase sigma factor [Tepidisphaeraceae bacterium]